MNYLSRFLEPFPGSFFLFGPRGTGKTVWARKNFPHALYIDLLNADEWRVFEGYPERLRDVVEAEMGRLGGEEVTIVIDEIQRVPQLLDAVHGLIASHPKLRFALTGSSAWKLRRGGVNLLGGRAVVKTMHPFMGGELGERFSMADALDFGMLPVVVNSPKPREFATSYARVYLEEEVRLEGAVRKLGAFARFLEIAALSHGTVPNCRSIGRECGISGVSVASYFSILEDFMLSFSVAPFHRNSRRRMVMGPKIYLSDAGVYLGLRPERPVHWDSTGHGFGLEGLVAQHLRAWCDYSDGGHHLYYWRTAGGAEVDFVVCGRDQPYAFEVKSTQSPDVEHIKNLRKFGAEFPEAHLVLLHRGPYHLLVHNVECIPCERFLRELHPNQIPTTQRQTP